MNTEHDASGPQYERLIAAAGASLPAPARARAKRRFKEMISGKGQTMNAMALQSGLKVAPIDPAGSRMLAAGVMLALAVGLFAMVRHQPGHSGNGIEKAAFVAGPKGPVTPFQPGADDDGHEARKPEPAVNDMPEPLRKALLEALSAGDMATMERLLRSRDGVRPAEAAQIAESKDAKAARERDAERLALIEAEVAALKARMKQRDEKAENKNAPVAVQAPRPMPPAVLAPPAPVVVGPGVVGVRVRAVGAGGGAGAGIVVGGPGVGVMAGGGPAAGPAAAPNQAAAPAPAKELTADERKELVKAVEDLGSDDFNTRDVARKLLVKAGASAKDILETGAKSEDAERSHTCKDMLDALANGGKQKAAKGNKSTVIQGGQGAVTFTIETDDIDTSDIVVPLPPAPVPVPEPEPEEKK
jgi:hypothetical protein